MNNIAHIDQSTRTQTKTRTGEFEQLNTHYDARYKIGWFLMSGEPRPCFTPTLLKELDTYLAGVEQEMKDSNGEKYDFLVVDSDVSGIFNLGGDLNLFTRMIDTRDRDGLYQYAAHCIDILYRNMYHHNQDLTTISLIQGDALGGGFEAALSSNLIIAERGAKIGLPEVLFNLFPGMGAYSLLSRKIGAQKAEQMILSGHIFSAEEMHEMGVVDVLAEKGEGEMAVYKYAKHAQRSRNTMAAMRKVKDVTNPVTMKELLDIAEIWADAALKLTAKDLKMMQRLVKRQNTRMVSNA
ncbi:enoyl-CoA hydratase [Solemya velum gill symbiont]|uniref:Enoyl-CoA hydratase n=1 Tax=Solemya velum gill symbiont TaxID=2340 RepID=A0A1T2CNV3_SOVGS|nr:crotonase/enoyl-CoA hydratase family protein [Solemya velum gill symbiont]OOY33884.1 enoyl-CoA hydratase [Solemya velum gill symbiont]OOY36539.1 enoyl-CoA hydratase [Solemya velum gill symbiont]OOY39345.1 enoyl-CoA hydratase [Solemya velum gill symbiont]OOY44754.1 enoyl-CoA hydratase [Solemya velum gill symbiont]OOY45731.1 enoyl-CoA hydratase [Solemya velum gill symbiont]